ncbi:uncharacterized protein Z520_07744 [Fonsecaea multimorphosa CBS 102226]|uniref:Cytochrome P450 n=1 Tax=Fonsecaea multimorphosa CBS 102226 TaxID=1442371 RepID=A0A0D2KIN9_9EURO|nr:uncharacterized protein Z520_07744 [Fonsecaea multimorphosa CBS 102226]KIX96478.1 hypothetical protein Z520_07744 [Fonsecaea multimorphosa CBS 102226]OAL28321.1 hypothetical protein AYO22_03027 [Fonsecaea multimorphosa]
MNNLVKNPDRAFDYARLYAASVAAILAWGFRAADLDSFFYKDFYNFVDQFLEAIEPGANPPVEVVPALWYLPGSWKKRANHVRDMMDSTWSKARKMVDDRRASGDIRDSIIDMKIAEYDKSGWDMSQHAFNNLFGELLEAGADTTANMILTIILAITKFPEVQAKARKELDAVCGTERTPLFSDFQRLPYINCIIKEALRWRPTSDLGIPHRVARDDWYNGMYFPKDCTVWLAAWAIHHNDDIYPDHERFNPDRFLNHDKLANEYAAVEANIFPGYIITDTAPVEECVPGSTSQREAYHPLDVNAYTSSNLVRPLEFQVKVTPRSEQHQEVIERELIGALGFLDQYRQ